MTDLFFCPECWKPDEMISTNAASLVQTRGYSGRTVDAWQFGDWDNNWTAISSQIPVEAGWLESGGEYRFCFWLNGGENSRGDETCQLEIFGDAWEERLVFPLNRDRTKPLLEKNHWLLYAIPFTAPQAQNALHLRFVAAGAVCTVTGIPDMDMSACEQLTPDEHSSQRAQRYNIVFPQGYPQTKKQKKVVLKARGKELEIRRRTLTAGLAAAGIAVGLYTVYQLYKRRKK